MPDECIQLLEEGSRGLMATNYLDTKHHKEEEGGGVDPNPCVRLVMPRRRKTGSYREGF